MVPEPPLSRDRLLYRVAAELTSSLDLDEVLGLLMTRVIDLMSAARGFVVLLDRETGDLQVRTSRGETDQALAEGFLGSRTVIEEVIATGRPVVTMDATADHRFRGQDSVVLHNLRSIMAVPLLVKGTVIGALYVDNPLRVGIFVDADREFFQALSDLAAIAIDNARLYSELRENFERAEFLRRTFERYVNKQVTDWVLGDPNRDQVFLPGQRLEVTILASDIAGFSQLSQSMEAEALVSFLNRYFRRMVDIVIAHGGNLDKFLGDGLLVAFGAPVPMPDSAEHALAAARDMAAAVAEMNAERTAAGDPPVQVGIGIDSGSVVAGNVGSELRLEYTLIGIPVNNATFLSKRRPAAVLLSRNTQRLLKDASCLRRLRSIVLKGATRAEPIYALPQSARP